MMSQLTFAGGGGPAAGVVAQGVGLAGAGAPAEPVAGAAGDGTIEAGVVGAGAVGVGGGAEGVAGALRAGVAEAAAEALKPGPVGGVSAGPAAGLPPPGAAVAGADMVLISASVRAAAPAATRAAGAAA